MTYKHGRTVLVVAGVLCLSSSFLFRDTRAAATSGPTVVGRQEMFEHPEVRHLANLLGVSGHTFLLDWDPSGARLTLDAQVWHGGSLSSRGTTWVDSKELGVATLESSGVLAEVRVLGGVCTRLNATRDEKDPWSQVLTIPCDSSDSLKPGQRVPLLQIYFFGNAEFRLPEGRDVAQVEEALGRAYHGYVLYLCAE